MRPHGQQFERRREAFAQVERNDVEFSLPASIFEKSRMSLMRVSSDSPDAWTMSRYSRCSLRELGVEHSSVMPMMPFIGVRISWLMLARNSLLARLAASAASLARFLGNLGLERQVGARDLLRAQSKRLIRFLAAGDVLNLRDEVSGSPRRPGPATRSSSIHTRWPRA